MRWPVVEKEREAEVPAHLRDANRDEEGFGHGEGYLYPHAYRDHWVAQQYLPDALQGRVFYQPGGPGLRGDASRPRSSGGARRSWRPCWRSGEGFGVAEVLTFTGAAAPRRPRSLAAAGGQRRRRAAGCRARPGASTRRGCSATAWCWT